MPTRSTKISGHVRHLAMARFLQTRGGGLNHAEGHAVSTTIGSNPYAMLNNALSSYAATGTTPTLAQVLSDEDQTSSQSSPATSVTLSDQAKAYLASAAATSSAAGDSAATLAQTTRSWLDQQYQALGISSAMLDGQVAVDLTGQSRAALSAVASNAEGLFTADESTAATHALLSRFSDAMTPRIVAARHTGDYAGLYDAALQYMNQAGADEQATTTWQDQMKALTAGAAAAKATFGKAPDTGNPNDLVHALLVATATSSSTASSASSSGTATDIASVAANARAMLDDQANSAKDNGTELVFDPTRKTGQQADLSQFDNRSLAAIALNQGSSFAPEEVRAAKIELEQRHRTAILGALNGTGNGGDSSGGALALLQQYTGMSAEEKSALGVTDQVTNRLVQSYSSAARIQNAFASA